MENDNIFLGPESLRIGILINCMCRKQEVSLMKAVSGTSASGGPANAALGLRHECPNCHRHIGVSLRIQPPIPG